MSKPKRQSSGKRRRYSDDFRATALAGLAANGGNVDRTAQALNIPSKTLEQWSKGTRNPVSAQLSELKRLDLSEVLEQYAQRLMEIPHEGLKGTTLKDVANAVAIIVEKVALLRSLPPTPAKESETTLSGDGVWDLSKMTRVQINRLGRFIDEMAGDGQVIYNPYPGDPDYDPGLEPSEPPALGAQNIGG